MADTATAAPSPLWTPDAVAAIERGRRMPATPVPDDRLERFVTWFERAPRQMKSSVGLTGSLVLVVLSVAFRVDGEWGDARQVLTHQVLGLGILLAATIATRAVSLRRVLSFWLLGYYLVGPFVDHVGGWLDGSFDGNGFTAGVVPVLEEAAKLAPVLLYALGKVRARWTPAASDLVVLGAAVGAGFAFYEDLLWSRVASSGTGGLGTLLPTMLQDPIFAAGHVVWTATAALGVGLMVLHRDRPLAFVAGPVLLLVPLADHAVINLAGPKRDDLRAFLLDGRLVPWLLIGGLLVAVVAEQGLRRDAARRDEQLPTPTASEIATARPVPIFGGGYGVRHYARRRNGVVYADHVHGHDPAWAPRADEALVLAWMQHEIAARATGADAPD